MSGSVATNTQTSGVNNPDLNSTISKLAKGVSAQYTPGQSLYQAPSANTMGSEAAALAAAGNPAYGSAVSGALGSFGNTAAGGDFGMNDPGYARLRQNTIDDTLQATNSAFNNSGLFGSNSNQEAAGKGVASAVAGLDYGNYQSDVQRQQAAAQVLPGLFSAGQLPASVQGQVGAAQDADAAAKAAGPTDYLGKVSGITGQLAGSAGTTSSTQVPWWEAILGGAATAAGTAAKFF